MMQIEPFTRQVQVFLKDLKSPEAKSKRLAEFAADGIAEIQQTNKAAGVGSAPPRITVDGKEGAPLASVRPDGIIVAEFNMLHDVLEWIGEQLLLESPRLTGKYMRSHRLEVDGVPHDLDARIPDGDFYQFINAVPYARKIEPARVVKRYRATRGDKRRFNREIKTGAGQSSQAPNGVYAAISAVAATRFVNIARISYSLDNYDEATGVSHPSINVRPF